VVLVVVVLVLLARLALVVNPMAILAQKPIQQRSETAVHSKQPHPKHIATTAMLLVTIIGFSMPTMLIQKTFAYSTRLHMITGFAFTPANVTIFRGDKIVWTNNDPVIHTLWFVKISDGSTYLLSDPILPGASWTHNFTEKVNLQYYSFGRLWISGMITVRLFGDLNGDNKCNILDLVKEAGKFGAEKGDPHSPPAPKYDPNYDFNNDNKINILDLVKLATKFGTTDP
jgi:plastocyanin